jgi:hypothetical protein
VNLTAQLSNKVGSNTTDVDTFWSLHLYNAKIKLDNPEFPTIGLPIAAMLGLMFIFSSRKKEE